MKLYELLGVNEDATQDEIRAAYRSMAQRHHPDKGGDRTTFQSIQRAYDVLSDPARRKRYDELGLSGPMPDLREQSLLTIAEFLMGVIDSADVDVDTTNILEYVAHKIANTKDNVESNIREERRKLNKRERAMKRLKAKEGKDGIASQLLHGAIMKQKHKMEEMQLASETLTLAFNILNDYDYEVDKQDFMDVYNKGGTRAAAWTGPIIRNI